MLVVKPCDTFAYTVDGGDFRYATSGTVDATAERPRLTADPAIGIFGPGGATAASGSSYRGLPTLLLTQGAASMLLARAPDVLAAAMPAPVQGDYLGVTLSEDLLAEDAGQPGPVLVQGEPVLVDGSRREAGTYRAVVFADGRYSEMRSFGLGTRYRRGTIDAWTGDQVTLRFQNGTGICSDRHAGAVLRAPVDGRLEIDTLLEIADVTDADSDGRTSDPLFARTRVVFQRR